jgi:pyruvate ferredoxin oxidoreductase gamma subunit
MSSSRMKEMIEVRWHRRKGQGVATVGKLLAEMAMSRGQYFEAFPDKGPKRMGAPIPRFTRLGTRPIIIHQQIAEQNMVAV